MARLRFVVSLFTKDNDYQVEQANSAKAAARHLGVDVEIIFADGNSITQSTQILKHVQAAALQRPSGIIVEPIGGTALPQVAKAAVAAGIGWAVLNRDAEYIHELRRTSKLPIFEVSTDHMAVGELQARQLAMLLPTGGHVLFVQGPSENFAAKERLAGLHRGLAPATKLTLLRAQWTEDSARKAVDSWLTLTTGKKFCVHAVAAQNDAMAIGTRKALLDVTNPAEREMWQSLPYLGVDGVPNTGQAWVRARTLRATVITPPSAGEAVTMMAEAITRHTTVAERKLLTPTSFPSLDALTPLNAPARPQPA